MQGHSFRAQAHLTSKENSAIAPKRVAWILYLINKTFLLICFYMETRPKFQGTGLMYVYTDHMYSVFTF